MTKKTFARILILAGVGAAIAASITLDLGAFLTLGALKERVGDLRSYYETRPAVTVAIYMALYVAATALSR